jgi:hypothetical protein
MSKSPTSVLFSDELLDEIEALVISFSQKENSFVSRSSLIVRAVKYGLPVLREELSMDFVVPKRSLPEQTRLALMAKQVFDCGLAVMGVPDASGQ